MNLLMIIFILILFSGIDGLNVDETTGVDVLETLKTKNISCDLHDFVKSTDNSEDEYKVLIHDLTKYCSNSESTKPYHLLCQMILIELEIGCLLPNNSRPSPIRYTPVYTAKQICSISRIALTNSWMWEKLSFKQKDGIGSTSINLCSRITSTNETLRLAKFFYKIAPRIRRSEVVKNTSSTKRHAQDSLLYKIPPINGISLERTNNSNFGLIPEDHQLLMNKIPEHSKVLNETAKKTGKKHNRILNRKPEQSALDANKTGNNEIINDSVDAEDEANNEQNRRLILDNRVPEQADLQKANEVQIKSENISKKNEEGFPLGRAGEKPEREQINERPKPKVLDVESVFKPNDHEERNWVEGKNAENPADNHLNANHNLPRMKYEENPLVIPQSIRKKSLFKLKFSRHFDNDGDNDNLSNNFITSILVFTLCIVLIYIILHNKNKVLGLIIEGCKRRHILSNYRTTTRHTRLSLSSD